MKDEAVELLRIDDERCVRCGLCVKVCPAGVIVPGEEGDPPAAARPDACILCGHCVAVCPHDAIEHNRMAPETFVPAEGAGAGADEVEAVLASKRSVRHFEAAGPERGEIERLLRAAEMAPSAHNGRQRGYVVVSDKAKINELEQRVADYYARLVFWLNPVGRAVISVFAPRLGRGLREVVPHLRGLVRRAREGKSPVFRGAPCVICIHAPKADPLSRDDCIGAQHYIMLQAHAMGLGTCIIGYATVAHKAVERCLGLPRENRAFAVTVVGRRAVRYSKGIARGMPDAAWQ